MTADRDREAFEAALRAHIAATGDDRAGPGFIAGWQAALAHAREAGAQEPVAVPAGWKLVPEELTPEIIRELQRGEQDGYRYVWPDVLAAAPAQEPVAVPAGLFWRATKIIQDERNMLANCHTVNGAIIFDDTDEAAASTFARMDAWLQDAMLAAASVSPPADHSEDTLDMVKATPAESGEEMLDALILATRPLMDWLEDRESSVMGMADIRAGLIGVEDILPDDRAAIYPQEDCCAVTFGHLRAIRKALVGEHTHALVMTSAEEREVLAPHPAAHRRVQDAAPARPELDALIAEAKAHAPQPGGAVKVKAMEFDSEGVPYAPANDPRIGPLKIAVEGECDGLDLADGQARIILGYIDHETASLEPSPSGWDAGAFEAGAKAMREACARKLENAGLHFCVEVIRALPLPTPPAGEG